MGLGFRVRYRFFLLVGFHMGTQKEQGQKVSQQAKCWKCALGPLSSERSLGCGFSSGLGLGFCFSGLGFSLKPETKRTPTELNPKA